MPIESRTYVMFQVAEAIASRQEQANITEGVDAQSDVLLVNQEEAAQDAENASEAKWAAGPPTPVPDPGPAPNDEPQKNDYYKLGKGAATKAYQKALDDWHKNEYDPWYAKEQAYQAYQNLPSNEKSQQWWDSNMSNAEFAGKAQVALVDSQVQAQTAELTIDTSNEQQLAPEMNVVTGQDSMMVSMLAQRSR